LEQLRALNPLILLITSDKESQTNWRQLSEHFQLKFDLIAYYFRFNSTEGHIVVDRQLADIETISKGIEYDNQTYNIKTAEGQDLKDFWTKHGEHY